MGRSTDAETIALYLVQEGSRRWGARWLGSRLLADPRGTDKTFVDFLRSQDVAIDQRRQERLVGVSHWIDLLEPSQLMGVRKDSRLGLLGWLKGHFALRLTHIAPEPQELLRLQSGGQRVVTWYQNKSGPLGRHAGPYEFLLHDLEHAQKFYGTGTHREQVEFFCQLNGALQKGWLGPWLKKPGFRAKLEYLMADMNSHPEHLRLYLRAILREACQSEAETRQLLTVHEQLVLPIGP